MPVSQQVDAVRAFEIARDYILQHGPSYWVPPFWIDQGEGRFLIRTSCASAGGNAEIEVDEATGSIISVDGNPE